MWVNKCCANPKGGLGFIFSVQLFSAPVGRKPLAKNKSLKNPEVLVPKLDSLARCILRIESKKPFTVAQLGKDADLQDVISVNLERAVQQCVDIASICLAEVGAQAPSTMEEGFALLY